MRSVVLLPAPLGPRKPKVSPSATARSKPDTASTTTGSPLPAPPLEALAQSVYRNHFHEKLLVRMRIRARAIVPREREARPRSRMCGPRGPCRESSSPPR